MAIEEETEKGVDVDNIVLDRQQSGNLRVAATKCRFCAKKIDPSAIFCTECEKYQDWRRFFSFSQLVLTLLIALISVASTGIPFLLQATKKDASDVKASHLQCTSKAFEVVISNLGNRVAVLRGGKFKLIQKGNKENGNIHFINAKPIDENPQSLLINPGQPRIVKISRKDKLLFPVADKSDEPCKYHLTLDVIGFNQKPESPDVECSCT